MTPRARLAAAATAAGYPAATLTLIAEAALPRYHAGEQLDDSALQHVASAAELLAEAGISAAALPQLVEQHQRADADGWRERFWSHPLHSANAHPQPDPATPDGTSSTPRGRPGDAPSSAHTH
jgi:hypothetical protein